MKKNIKVLSLEERAALYAKKKALAKERKEQLNPLKINILNIWKRYPKKVLWMFVSAFLYNVAIAVFLKKAATIASGTSSLSQIITFLAPSTEQFYGLFYVLVNLPLMIFFWWKNPRMFMVLTYYWMLFQVGIQLIFIDYNGASPIVKFINEGLSIYNPNGKGSYWDPYGKEGTNVVGKVWNKETWPVIVYASLGGVCEGFASVIAWTQKGSIGGTSVISNYIASKTKKPIGNTFLIVALCFSSFSTIVVGSLESVGYIKGHPWRPEQFIVRIMGTFIYLFLLTFIVNKFYPKYKKVKIDIHTKKPEIVAEAFKKFGYVHAFNIFYGVGGYSHTEFGKIETVALYLERDTIINEVKRVDKNAWITISNIHGLVGEFDTSYVD
ncbi:YitT family protein [Mycoplasma phocoeninasale]|uniref:YitT family protein n=1 Tax=Mycoplasma phocoeninasale TaxID=2726117 RepID=UPI001967530C|nr:YitT family protein [Mycoplasma phocoeninasale]